MTIDRGLLVGIATGGPPPEYVRRLAALGFGVTIEDLCSASRVREFVLARHVAMAAVRELTDASFPAIGRLFGDRDHTTVMNACARARALPELRRAKERLCEEVRIQWAIDSGQPVPVRGQMDLMAGVPSVEFS